MFSRIHLIIKKQKFFGRLFCLTTFFLAFCALVKAQEDVIRVKTDLVSFEITVTDQKGKPMRGLTVDDFKIFDNGIERNADFFEPIKKAGEKRPLSIVFALDVSGSMTAEELARLRDAMQAFIQKLADYDSYFAVMTFGMEVKTLQTFTNQPQKLEKTFERLMGEQNGLSTHAYDAADDAIRLITRKSPKTLKNKFPKRAVILITDGFPVGDTVSPQTVIERANDAETSIYTVILPSFSRLQLTRKPLPTPLDISGIAERTGGQSFYAGEKNFEPLFKSLAEEITSSYLLAFYPKEESKSAETFREVKIESIKGFNIRQNRNGYRVNAP